MTDHRRRLQAALRADRSSWYGIRAAADRSARIDLYDEIGWSWYGGISAKDFVRELNELDVDTIELHINSPGGDVFDGIAITNALRDHPARVVATVDGLAASAASVILQAADDRVMNRNTELMIHDPWGLAIGNAADMREFADQLDRTGVSLAGVYADRAGGTVEQWRAAMLAETWYTAEEAVAAGLADRVLAKDDTGEDGAAAKARWDLSVYAHAGRRAAPGPKPPAPPGPSPERSTPVATEITDEQLKRLREQAGVEADADLDTTLDAIEEKVTAPAPDAVTPAADPVVAEQLAALKTDNTRMSGELAAIKAKHAADEKAAFFASAKQTGRLKPADEKVWSDRWDKAGGADFVRDVIGSRTPGSEVPIAALGYTGDPGSTGDKETATDDGWLTGFAGPATKES